MIRKEDSAKGRISAQEIRKLKVIVEATLRQSLEAEMDEELHASEGERTAGQFGYLAG